MAWQLIYTSAPRTLTAGQTGYGTVARSEHLREALIQRLEQLSYFQHGDNRATTPPVIHAYRILDLRGAKYHVLTRLVDAGLDFTNRTNHLAHHLIFTPEELATRPSPALIFLHWAGWRNSWTDEPRFLDAGDWLGFDDLPRAAALPAENWSRLTNDAARAAALLTRPAASGCQLACEPGQENEWLALFAESLQLLDPEKKSPAQRWTFPFTTHLQEQDQPNDFRWRGGEPGSPIAHRATDLPVPSGELAELAQRGPKKPFIPPATPRVGAAPVVTAKPVLAKLDNSTARPLRLQSRTTGTAARIDDSADEPRRSLGARQAAPVVVALLAVFLVLGFWKPGWFKRESKAPPPIKEAVGPQNGAGEAPIIKDNFAEAFAEKKSPPAAAPKSTPSTKAIEELKQRLGSVPTYLYIHDFTTSLKQPAPPQLVSLFDKIMTGIPPAITCRAVANALRLDALESSVPLNVSPSDVGRHLRARGKTSDSDEFKIVCDWSTGQTTNMTIEFTAVPTASLTMLFQPKGDRSFEPFRILIANAPGTSAPVQLSKTFLSIDQTNVEHTVGVLVWEKLKAIQRPAGFDWQLRPFVNNPNNPPADLHDQLSTHLPLPREGLDFATVRSRLQGLLDTNREKSLILASEINKLRDTIRPALTNKLSEDEVKKSDQQKSATEISRLRQQLNTAGFKKQMEGLKENHFTARWESLNSNMKTLDAKTREQQAANREAIRLADALKKIPDNLADTAYVGLFLADERNEHRRLEVIRFTDASEPKTK